jgi:hypothetical protein
MLTFLDHAAGEDCDGTTRRDFLRIGTLGLGGLTLPGLLAAQAAASEGRSNYVRGKSVVFLFLCGGPSHIETFDPHMDRPAPQCSVTGETKTLLSGVSFGGTLEKLAARADRLAIVRSYSPHDIADHALAIRHVLVAGDPLGQKSSIGAIATKIRGESFSRAGSPTFVELIEDEIEDQYREDMERMRLGNGAGELGASCAPFAAWGGDGLQQNMKLNLPLARLNERRTLHASLDRLQRQIDSSGSMASFDEFEGQAVELLLGGRTREALDLSREDPRVVERYDTSHLSSGWHKRRPSTLGKRLLMARRLCEAGAAFVTVGMAGWDNHGNGNHPGVFEGMHTLGLPFDHAVSAFLDDINERGLSDDILLVVTGEFGRGPKFENQGGRPHWPGLCALAFAGGGLNMGQVIGRSLPTADYPATQPYRLSHMVATLMHAMFDVGQLRLDSSLPRALSQFVQSSEPIRELF